tara:strand:+ start:8157 stop:8456 length:300 start_codon:yes stop_codon:yes gene_type:complete
VSTAYDIVAKHGGKIELDLLYKLESGDPVALDDSAVFFQIGQTKPYPGTIDGNRIRFDFKPNRSVVAGAHPYRVIVKNLKSEQWTKIMWGELKVERHDD